MMLYKYVGPNYLDKVFSGRQGVTFKCSYPHEFNDPYELFLTIRFDQDPEALAFYQDVIGDIPQHPTTCFSRSPAVIPMWAHYADNHTGVVVEFSEEKLQAAFSNSRFGNVQYRDTPHEGLEETFAKAHVIGKPRYFHMLHSGVLSAAYYTKTTSWAYEQERRMLLSDSEVRTTDGLMLMDVPPECVASIAVGARASDKTRRLVEEQCNQMECDYREMRIGRSSAVPFFIDESGDSFVFDGDKLTSAQRACHVCKEPSPAGGDTCSWCNIQDSHREDAASRNTYRLLDHYGLLEGYIQGMQAIDKRFRK